MLYERLFPADKKTKKKGKKCNEEAEDQVEENPIQVLVDILLSLLSKPSSHFRELATQVFSSCCGRLTKDSLKDLLKIVVQKTQLGRDEDEDDEDGAPITQEELKARGLLKEDGQPAVGNGEEKKDSDDDNDAAMEDGTTTAVKGERKIEDSDEEEDEMVSMGDAMAMNDEFDNQDLAVQNIVLMRKQQRQQAKG